MTDQQPGSRLRSARRRLRLSQAAVAAFVGSTRQGIAAVESGSRQPDLAQLVGMANLYRLTLDELVGGTQSAVRPSRARPIHTRLNKVRDLTEQDREEIASFDSYLLQRPRSGHALSRRPAGFETISDCVRRVVSEAQLPETIPVPIFGLLAKFGIEVRFTALGELAGALLVSADPGMPHGILINSDQPYDRQRFSAGHELGHLVLDHQAHDGGFVSYLGRRFESVEVQADQFAAELLMPEHLLKSRLDQLPQESVEITVYRLARLFLVSYQATITRLFRLGCLGPAQKDKLDKVKPSEIAKKTSNLSSPTRAPLRDEHIAQLIRQAMPRGWNRKADPDTVRLLQETVYTQYVTATPGAETTEPAAIVYERVAVWVAKHHPIVRAAKQNS